MKKRFFPLPLLLAAALLLSACGASVPDATQSLTESMLSALSDDDFAAAAELLDSESGLGENNIRSYIYALEAETDCDFSNGARVVGYTAYEDYTDEINIHVQALSQDLGLFSKISEEHLAEWHLRRIRERVRQLQEVRHWHPCRRAVSWQQVEMVHLVMRSETGYVM